MNARDKFLTEAMKMCWHDRMGGSDHWHGQTTYNCTKCGNDYTNQMSFDNWFDFGLLWEWAQKQEWSKQFLREFANWNALEDELFCHISRLVNPSSFADALYDYLKQREN